MIGASLAFRQPVLARQMTQKASREHEESGRLGVQRASFRPGPTRLMASGSKANDTGLEFHFSQACVEPPRTDISATPGTAGEEFAQ